MLKRIITFLLVFTVCLGVAHNATAISSAGVLFLRIGAGVRASGMGDAFVAVANDASATHWNPAGLGQSPLSDAWNELDIPWKYPIEEAVAVPSTEYGQRIYEVWLLSQGQLRRLVGSEWISDLALPEDITEVHDMAVGAREFVIATDNGLYRNSNQTWLPMVPPTDEGWEVEQINDMWLSSGAEERLWLATDDGLKVYNFATWETYGTEAGLPSPKINQVYFPNSKEGWIVTAAGFVHFTDGMFMTTATVKALIGQTIPEIAADFIGSANQARVNAVAEEIRRINHIEGDDLEPGAELLIPYEVVFESPITSLHQDALNRLWVGTEQGLKMYHNNRWTSFGYRAFTPEDPISLTDLAEQYLGSSATPSRVEAFTNWTAHYNSIETDATIDAGETVYLYRSPVGGTIRSIHSSGAKVFVGSKYGYMIYEDGRWGRLHQHGLNNADGIAIVNAGNDLYFMTPSKIVWYERAQSTASFMAVKWLPKLAEDIYFAYGALSTHIDGLGTIGFNTKVLSYGEVARTEASSSEVIGSFNPFDFAFGFTYGTRLNNNLSAGLTGKVIYSRLSEQGAGREVGKGTATAFALDAGLLYQTPFKRLKLGAALTNFGPDITYIDADQSDPLPRNLTLGLAYKLADSPFNNLTLAVDLNKELVDLSEASSTELRQIIYNVGMEYWYAKTVALRVGYIYDQEGDIKTPTVGGGLLIKGLGIDLAYIPSVREDQVMANILRVQLSNVWY